MRRDIIEKFGPGDIIETFMWLGGNETPGQLERFKADVLEQMSVTAGASGYALGPLRWRTVKPGDECVSQPHHVDGPDVRLLVGEATVMQPPSFFTAQLGPEDLEDLRGLTRHAHALKYPAELPLSDAQCDTYINDLGPDAAVAALSRGQATIQ